MTNDGHISWTGVVIVSIQDDSYGRDLASFRMVNPVVNNDLLGYTIERSRDRGWKPMQRVHINRLSGEAVSYFITMLQVKGVHGETKAP